MISTAIEYVLCYATAYFLGFATAIALVAYVKQRTKKVGSYGRRG